MQLHFFLFCVYQTASAVMKNEQHNQRISWTQMRDFYARTINLSIRTVIYLWPKYGSSIKFYFKKNRNLVTFLAHIFDENGPKDHLHLKHPTDKKWHLNDFYVLSSRRLYAIRCLNSFKKEKKCVITYIWHYENCNKRILNCITCPSRS